MYITSNYMYGEKIGAENDNKLNSDITSLITNLVMYITVDYVLILFLFPNYFKLLKLLTKI